jgi:MarR family transcriptional repressor of emrRAB
MLKAQIERVESGLQRVKVHLPALPIDEILLSRLIVILGRDISAAYDRLLRPHGLTEADFRVLAALFAQVDGSASPSDLCASNAHSPANMTRISDALVERGLITRVMSEQDRRRMVLQITPKGTALLHEFLPMTSGLARAACACLSQEEMRHVTAQLKRMAGALDAAGTEPEAGGES